MTAHDATRLASRKKLSAALLMDKLHEYVFAEWT